MEELHSFLIAQWLNVRCGLGVTGGMISRFRRNETGFQGTSIVVRALASGQYLLLVLICMHGDENAVSVKFNASDLPQQFFAS